MALLTAVVCAFIILPIASSAYLGDDLFNSAFRGLLAEHGTSFFETVWATTIGFFQSTARFMPALYVQLYGVHSVFPNLAAYKAYQVAIFAFDLVLFALFLRAIRLDAPLIAVSVLMVAATMQFHGHYDGYLGFSAMNGYLLALMLGSWLFFASYLRRSGWPQMAGALLLYLVAVLSYEMCYPLSAVHALIAVRLRGGASWRTAWPFLLISVAAFTAFGAARVAFPQQGDAVYALRLDPRWYLPTLINQTTASIPLAYLAFFHQKLFSAGTHFGGATPWWLLVSLGAAGGGAAFIALRSVSISVRELTIPAIIGGWIWFDPALLLSAIPRYQREVAPGFGYQFMVFGGFGAAIVFSCAIAALIALAKGRARIAAAAAGAAAFAIIIAASFETNERTLQNFERERAARINITAALNDGIVADVPPGARLVADTQEELMRRIAEIPKNSETLENPRMFVREQSGRSLQVRAMSENPSPLACGQATCLPAVRTYALRDVPFDVRDGYTVLGRLTKSVRMPDGTMHPLVTNIRIHLQGDRLARSAEDSGLAFAYRCGAGGDRTNHSLPLLIVPSAVRRGTIIEIKASCPVDLEATYIIKNR